MLPDRPQTTSEKHLRKALGEHFGVDMTERKGQIRELVTAYLSQVRWGSGREGRGAVQRGSAQVPLWSAAQTTQVQEGPLHFKQHAPGNAFACAAEVRPGTGGAPPA